MLQTTLEGRGYQFVRLSNPAEAIELLRTVLPHAVCIDCEAMQEPDSEAIGKRLKVAGPHTPLVLIQKNGDLLPPHFEEHADVVMDETSFLNFGHRRIEELRETRLPVFMQWIDQWRQRTAA